MVFCRGRGHARSTHANTRDGGTECCRAVTSERLIDDLHADDQTEAKQKDGKVEEGVIQHVRPYQVIEEEEKDDSNDGQPEEVLPLCATNAR